MRRYIIHADGIATWLLVSSEGVCRWRIERLGRQGEIAWFDFESFEKSEAGRRLDHRLKSALMVAQLDA